MKALFIIIQTIFFPAAFRSFLCLLHPALSAAFIQWALRAMGSSQQLNQWEALHMGGWEERRGSFSPCSLLGPSCNYDDRGCSSSVYGFHPCLPSLWLDGPSASPCPSALGMAIAPTCPHCLSPGVSYPICPQFRVFPSTGFLFLKPVMFVFLPGC